MQTLDEMNFKHFGSTYLDSKTRKQDVVMTAEVKGVKIGAIGFSIPQDKDLPAMKQRIEQLRADGVRSGDRIPPLGQGNQGDS